MITDNFERDRELLEKEYSENSWKKGICTSELLRKCEDIKRSDKNLTVKKAKLIDTILRYAEIDVSPYSLFADKINHANITDSFKWERKMAVEADKLSGVLDRSRALVDARVFTSDVDFGHTCPDWAYILDNGLPGILKNIEKHLEKTHHNSEEYEFYSSAEIVYSAAIVYVSRLADEAERLSKCGNENMLLLSGSLRALTKRAPETLHEAMQMIFIWYMLQQHIDAVYVRSVGRLDGLLYKYYIRDIENGIITEIEARTLIKYFLLKMGAKKAIANIPFALCGSDENGNDVTNPLTFMILDEYIALNIEDPKIHIRCHKNIDENVIRKVLCSIRDGKNSFVFMNDGIVEGALVKMGASFEDARRYSIVGCYEPCAYGEIPCTCAGRINIPQAVMLTLNDGFDILSQKQMLPKCGKSPDSFDAFLLRFYEILGILSDKCIILINEYERNYMDICPSPIFSASDKSCMENGKDIYAGGARYNNTSVNAFGLATSVDSLMAIKKAVYDDKLLSLDAMSEILKNNWKGSELLRKRIENTFPKYGNGHKAADALAKEIVSVLDKQINGKPNGRGGAYRLGLFSIDWRFEFGKLTPATPDGRPSGETLSKNMCPTLGCDKNGVTSLINSVTKIDYTSVPNGTVLDVLLHSSAVSGEDGLSAMEGLLSAYLAKGGGAIQFNVLDPAVLRDAQGNPDKYKTLQVRLCGWNVHFVNLSSKEQNEFIRQAEDVGA